MTVQTKEDQSGSLRIGDEWNAIRIIAYSQTNPLKAVCELVENAIDARASHIVITRKRVAGEAYLEIVDNGNGVKLNKAGVPDFEHLATHICDSLKRHLGKKSRKGIHGEFGIGLFSFWNLGEEMRMTSLDKQGEPHELFLKRGEPEYEIKKKRSHLFEEGTTVLVGPLLESTRNVVTGDKLQRYLGSELRDRIRDRGVVIEIADKISRKDLVVKPIEFTGERIDNGKPLKTRFGSIKVALYLEQRGKKKDDVAVAVGKDGTRVLSNICELMQFDHAPWTDSRLQGMVDFPALRLAPGTRQGIVPDMHLDAFVEAVSGIEDNISQAIRQRDEAETAKANKQVLLQVKKAFITALQQLEDQYLYFDVPGVNHKRSKGKKLAPGSRALPLVKNQSVVSKPGQLDAVLITPRNARRAPGSKCILVAESFDTEGPLDAQVAYEWSIKEGKGTLSKIEGNRCVLKSRQIGRVVVQVIATAGMRQTVDQVDVRFITESEAGATSTRGLPGYRLQAAANQSWRSKFDVKQNEIIINSAHRDFIDSKNISAIKHRRYIGKLYAKEVVLLNFPHESSAESMERLIEVMVRTEDAL